MVEIKIWIIWFSYLLLLIFLYLADPNCPSTGENSWQPALSYISVKGQLWIWYTLYLSGGKYWFWMHSALHFMWTADEIIICEICASTFSTGWDNEMYCNDHNFIWAWLLARVKPYFFFSVLETVCSSYPFILLKVFDHFWNPCPSLKEYYAKEYHQILQPS